MHVLPVVMELLAKHPALEVRFLLLDRVVSLAEEGIDVAVRIGHLPDSSLKSLTIGQVRWVLCASPAYLERAGVPRTLESLSRHDCIAFTATTPVVASNAIGNEEIVLAPEAGCLTTARTAGAIGEGVKKLFSNYPDREATRRYAERFSWDETTRSQLRLFSKILDDRQSASTGAAHSTFRT
jgi:DNA-binding transcriptional LysR family regulator